jgi:hypothetical protein
MYLINLLLTGLISSFTQSFFWLLIMGGISLCIWLLFKNIIDYLMTDISSEEKKKG